MTSAARGPYDHDVAVVGGGPAGLAAAIRLRWVKGYDPFPASVAVFDPAPLGGLGGWGSCVLSGPSWTLGGEELVRRLTADVEGLSIPHLAHRVTSLARKDGLLEVTAGDRSVRVLAVVLAPGFRALGDERRFFPEGVLVAMKGRAHVRTLWHRACEMAAERGLVVVGNDRSIHLARLHVELGLSTSITWVLEDSATAGSPREWPGTVVHGRLDSVLGGARVEGVRLDTSEGPRSLGCGAVFLDYHAFEISPALDIEGLDELGVVRSEHGFVEIDAWGATGAPGIFAAGDVTGRYAATLTALGDGVSAGFSAYRHVHLRKFGTEPDLFAYRGLDLPLPRPSDATYSLPAHAVPVLVGDTQRARRWLLRGLDEVQVARLFTALSEARTVGELASDLGLDVPRLSAILREAIHGRELTIHVLAGPDRELGRGSAATAP